MIIEMDIDDILTVATMACCHDVAFMENRSRTQKSSFNLSKDSKVVLKDSREELNSLHDWLRAPLGRHHF